MRHSQLELLKYIVHKTGDAIHILSSIDQNLLDCALKYDVSLEMLLYLIEQKVNVNEHFSFLHLGNLSNEKITIVSTYLRSMPIILQKLLSQDIMLFVNPTIVSILIDLGWDPNYYPDPGSCLASGTNYFLKYCENPIYNDSLRVVCASGKADFNSTTQGFIIFATSGARNPIGWALENNNRSGAKILFEHGASPSKYLLVLLLIALHEEDKDFFDALMKKSVVCSYQEAESYLSDWHHNDYFSKEDAIKALDFLRSLTDASKDTYGENSIPHFVSQILNLVCNTVFELDPTKHRTVKRSRKIKLTDGLSGNGLFHNDLNKQPKPNSPPDLVCSPNTDYVHSVEKGGPA